MPTTRRRADRETVSSTDVAEFSRLVSERFAPLSVTAEQGRTFHGRIRGRVLGTVQAFDVRANQHSVTRSLAEAAATPRDTYMVHVQLSGRSYMVQSEKSAELAPGDVAFYDSDVAYSIEADDDFHHMILVMPRAALAVPAAGAAELAATRLGESGIGAIVSPFLVQLAGVIHELPSHIGIRMARNAADVLGTAILAELGSSTPPESRSARPRLWLEALAYIDDHLDDPDLSPSRIANELFVSVRLLHLTFAERDQSVGGWIRTRRLESCARDIADPFRAGVPLSRIAAEHGYHDSAHFSRLFKAVYGESPRDYRGRHPAR
ncbi:helix-turn-helix domain-containing protein [Sinomonas sp. ASV322]|uniref:AraC-like ligand-binding domain-containing protein n=1 Tax=Sinomonas sp. ASV322 TaxID=3041920 RepID=UPI0027DD21A4|nr:helix-turn-helix domain-containing protein [Sinomonas sp. ASV322]MDQ4500831.1 helix-turn-helix domain-containing protein [Sinomonas sp. ASV322]